MYKDKILNSSTFKRQDFNATYKMVMEDSEFEDDDEMDYEQRKRLRDRRKAREVPYRVELMRMYDQETRTRLEHECSTLFYSGIDFQQTETENAIAAFDMLYQIYCTKFLQLDVKEEKRDELSNDGRNGLVKTAAQWKEEQGEKGESDKDDSMYVLKVILSVFGAIFVLLYYCAVYFSLYDKDDK